MRSAFAATQLRRTTFAGDEFAGWLANRSSLTCLASEGWCERGDSDRSQVLILKDLAVLGILSIR